MKWVKASEQNLPDNQLLFIKWNQSKKVAEKWEILMMINEYHKEVYFLDESPASAEAGREIAEKAIDYMEDMFDFYTSMSQDCAVLDTEKFEKIKQEYLTQFNHPTTDK